MYAVRGQWFNNICQIKDAQFANIKKQTESFVVPILDRYSMHST